MCEIYSKLTLKTPKKRHWHHSGVIIASFEQILHIAPMFPLLTLIKSMPDGLGPSFLYSTKNTESKTFLKI